MPFAYPNQEINFTRLLKYLIDEQRLEKEQREKMSINQYNFVTVLLLGMIDRLE
ncbi:MAG: hypothetical protein IM473_10515 [Microcystis sp. M015S2]|uniref:hypothetical protein n=1 Tax=unclassified Microcystis TaxID=2643300 RepID=UPI0025895844|nr:MULTISPECIES: hypothetical protein [unclassified Microcystis]MCA2653112.1 hypothetical protein [Microcystis sp. M061S2]MCA2708662.1 hypothetical protein [Microcystis sp. M025S2]MCA2742825.1 hypothetical protein [Microcystis sp. M015S2]MCA2757594.1 hypothetical protein [Microcystis sp. M145S2]